MLNEREPAFVLASQFHLYLLWVNAFNQEKVLVGASSVIVKTSRLVHAALVRMVITPLHLAPGGDQDTSSSGQ